MRVASGHWAGRKLRRITGVSFAAATLYWTRPADCEVAMLAGDEVESGSPGGEWQPTIRAETGGTTSHAREFEIRLAMGWVVAKGMVVEQAIGWSHGNHLHAAVGPRFVVGDRLRYVADTKLGVTLPSSPDDSSIDFEQRAVFFLEVAPLGVEYALSSQAAASATFGIQTPLPPRALEPQEYSVPEQCCDRAYLRIMGGAEWRF